MSLLQSQYPQDKHGRCLLLLINYLSLSFCWNSIATEVTRPFIACWLFFPCSIYHWPLDCPFANNVYNSISVCGERKEEIKFLWIFKRNFVVKSFFIWNYLHKNMAPFTWEEHYPIFLSKALCFSFFLVCGRCDAYHYSIYFRPDDFHCSVLLSFGFVC